MADKKEPTTELEKILLLYKDLFEEQLNAGEVTDPELEELLIDFVNEVGDYFDRRTR